MNGYTILEFKSTFSFQTIKKMGYSWHYHAIGGSPTTKPNHKEQLPSIKQNKNT